MNKLMKFLTSRAFIISLMIFFQIALIAMFLLYLSQMFVPVYVGFLCLNVIAVVAIINKNSNPMFKVAWIIPVLIFPVCGVLFYIMFGRTHLNKKNQARIQNAMDSAIPFIPKNGDCLRTLEAKRPNAATEAKYIVNTANTDVFGATETEYFCPGIGFYEKLLYELKKAKRFIFLEYFIVEEGVMWSGMLEILQAKLAEGVEIRLMFDDIGSINKVNADFPDKLRKMGFQVAVFNPYKPSLDQFLNYRDHRKFTIIDGRVVFTGGINIADEYIGATEKFGVWEDSAIMLRGDAVNRITMMFLQIWYFTTGVLPDYAHYVVDFKANHDGYVVPFSDEPLDQVLVCENAYINMIENATKYVYICTPYLIIDNVMTSALIRAAHSGVDVRIITPHIPDKKMVFYMTQSNYPNLISEGVKIYEFTPGFMHTKSIVADDVTAIVGTANFDYRSFYLHFENGVWMHKSKAVYQVKESFLTALEQSTFITEEYVNNISFWKKLASSLLKVFAPLL